MTYSQIAKGTLLVATPEIDTGLFFRGVILVCEHNPAGSFGLVLNKALDVALPQDILDLAEIANPHVTMRAGGPVQTNQMMLLHNSNSIPHQTLKICEEVYLGGDLQFLQHCLANEEGPTISLCFGYAGWTAGQLGREYLDGHWLLHPASSHYIFDVSIEKMWQTILRDMGGKHATLSMIPEDLSLN